MTTKRQPRSIGRLARVMRDHEKCFIALALRTNLNHRGFTAKWLGISRKSLYTKMKEHGL